MSSTNIHRTSSIVNKILYKQKTRILKFEHWQCWSLLLYSHLNAVIWFPIKWWNRFFLSILNWFNSLNFDIHLSHIFNDMTDSSLLNPLYHSCIVSSLYLVFFTRNSRSDLDSVSVLLLLPPMLRPGVTQHWSQSTQLSLLSPWHVSQHDWASYLTEVQLRTDVSVESMLRQIWHVLITVWVTLSR